VPAVAFGWNSDNNPERIIKGAVYIDDIPVGGKEVEAVRKAVRGKLEAFPETPVQLVYLNKSWTFTFAELGVSAQVDQAVKKAQQLGRSGPLSQRVKERWKALSEGWKISVPVVVEKEKAWEKLQSVANDVETKAKNARYIYHNQKAEIIPHVYGRHLDVEEAIQILQDSAAEEAADPDSKVSLNLPVEITYPKVTRKILRDKPMTHVTGSYVTYFNTGQVGRSKNIVTAAKYLDGFVVPPGETFSFNEAVGPRTKEAGFEEALIIIDEQFTPGMGGGVCQVSSTLYNAALKAGMKIKERTRHSKVIGYVPVGLDAAVSYGYLDLKFINSTDAYIAICAEVYGGTLSFKILSERPNPYTIEVRSFIESTVKPRTQVKEDSGIPEGKEYIQSPGKNGHVTRVERIWYQDGKEVRRETISRDFYPAEARVIIRGSHESQVVKPEEGVGNGGSQKKAGEKSRSGQKGNTGEDSNTGKKNNPGQSSTPGESGSSGSNNSGQNNNTEKDDNGRRNNSNLQDRDTGQNGKTGQNSSGTAPLPEPFTGLEPGSGQDVESGD